MQAVIMAGGKGTRLHAVTKDIIPKPMVVIQGKPLLQWQIEKLRDNGITDVFIITGHLGHVIREYFQDGREYGIHIVYYEEDEPLGTAGALFEIKAELDEQFFLVFGDVLFDVDLVRMKKFHEKKHADATLFVHPNMHPADSDLVVLDEENRIVRFEPKNSSRNQWYSNCVNAGLYLLSKKILNGRGRIRKLDLEKDLLMDLCSRQSPIYAYRSSEYIKDAGTPERMAAVAIELANGYVQARNLQKKQRAIFLDRDGTLNIKCGFIYRTEQLELEASAAEAVRMINQSGYLAIVITNQPSAAKGLCDISEIEQIHRKMETLLGKEGAYLDDIYFCPHHPQMKCRCRKPDTGMIEESVTKYNIDVHASWMVGDSTVDIQTGQNAGIKTALVLTGDAGRDRTYDVRPNIVGENVLSAVKQIIEREGVHR